MNKSGMRIEKLARAVITSLAVAICAGTVMAAGNVDSNQIREIKVSQTGKQSTIVVTGSLRPTYTAFKLSSPRRLVVDLANSHLKGVPSVLDASTPLISGVAVSQFTTGKVPVSRVMINFRKEASYRVKVKGNQLLISLNDGPDKNADTMSIEQEISLADQKTAAEIQAVRATAEKEISKARVQAKREVELANAKAEEAQANWRQATAELNKLKAQKLRFESDIEKARTEAAAAKTDLQAALKAQKAEAGSSLRNLSLAEKAAAKQIETLKQKIAAANASATREKAKSEKLEQRLAVLEQELVQATRASKEAVIARQEAESRAKQMKDEVVGATVTAGRAKEKARDAQQAQQLAAARYEKAAKEERERLRAVLTQREKETVEAKRNLESARAQRAKLDQKLETALAELKNAEFRAKKAAAHRQSIAAKADQEKAATQRKLSEMEAAVADARRQAEEAERQKRIAQGEIDKARAVAETASLKARREKEQAVKEARSRIALAEQTAKDSEGRLHKVQAEMANANNRIAQIEKSLAEANSTIAKQEAVIAEANSTIAKQQERISQLEKSTEQTAKEPVVARSADKEKPAAVEEGLTQEQIRLKRLAELQGNPYAPEPKTAAREKPAPSVVKPKPSTAPAHAISDIRFVNQSGVQKVVIVTDGNVTFSKPKMGKTKAVLEIEDADMEPMLERTLDVQDFGGSIRSISSFRDSKKVTVEVMLDSVAKSSISKTDGRIEWVFESRQTPVHSGPVKPLGYETRVVHREQADTYAYPQERTAAYSVKLKNYDKAPGAYTGRKIDLDFKDADIHNILRLLADVGQVNIVTADDVSGSVTIRMRNVPWDQALDVILQTKKLGKVRTGNLIRVAPMSVLESEFEKEIERRKMNRQMEPLETRLIPVSYATAAELSPKAGDLLTDRGKLSVDNRTNVLIARDTASTLDQIEALVRNLDTQTPQVLIEGRIVEATSTYAREIGIQWGGDLSASAATGNPTGLAFPSAIGVAGGATDSQTPVGGLSPIAGAQPNPNFAVNLPAPAGTGSGGALGITLGSIANNANLNLRLSAMEEEGTLRILSSPKILTMDNREAHIEQGTMIPYSRVSAQGVQTAFKEAKLNLTVTPHVTADGSVLLKINMTRDEPDFNNKGARGDPTILKREAETELLVNDGHTAVIGGIFTRNHGRSYKKVPFFGDIPILGWLFKTRSDSDRRSEMLIFITPTIVNRAESIGQ